MSFMRNFSQRIFGKSRSSQNNNQPQNDDVPGEPASDDGLSDDSETTTSSDDGMEDAYEEGEETVVTSMSKTIDESSAGTTDGSTNNTDEETSSEPRHPFPTTALFHHDFLDKVDKVIPECPHKAHPEVHGSNPQYSYLPKRLPEALDVTPGPQDTPMDKVMTQLMKEIMKLKPVDDLKVQKITEIMENHRVKVDRKIPYQGSRRLLHVAVTRGNAQLVSYLIDKGAKVRRPTDNGWSAIHFNVTWVDPAEGEDEKKEEEEDGKNTGVQVTRLLIAAGADPNDTVEVDDVQRTPLLQALQRKRYAMAEELLAAGAKLNTVVDKKGNTVMDVLVSSNDFTGVALLFNYGAHCGYNDEGEEEEEDGKKKSLVKQLWTPLHRAVSHEKDKFNMSMVKLLMHMGARKDVKSLEDASSTPHELAIKNNHKELVEHFDKLHGVKMAGKFDADKRMKEQWKASELPDLDKEDDEWLNDMKKRDGIDYEVKGRSSRRSSNNTETEEAAALQEGDRKEAVFE